MNNNDSARWWQRDQYDPDIVKDVTSAFLDTSYFHRLRLQHAARALWAYERDQWLGYEDFRQYADHNSGISPDYSGRAVSRWDSSYAKTNEIKRQVDALTAWLFTDQPRLQVRSNGVPFELRPLVLERSMALDSTVNGPKAKATRMAVGRDGLLTGWAAEMPRYADGVIQYKRLQPQQCWWDPVDAEDGNPWVFIVAERWDRGSLLAWYASLESDALESSDRAASVKAIEDMRAVGGDWLYGRDSYVTPYGWKLQNNSVSRMSDQVLVTHAWRRSTSTEEGKVDGRYVMMVSGEEMKGAHLIFDAPYGHRQLPVCWWSPYPSPSGGIAGLGLADALYGHQVVEDQCIETIQKHLQDLGWTKVIVDPSSKTGMDKKALEALATDGVRIIEVPGTDEPHFLQPPAVRNDLMDLYLRIRSLAQEDTGLGEVIVNGASDLAPDASGVARMQEAGRHTDRVSDVNSRWKDHRVAVGGATMRVIDDALKEHPDFSATFDDSSGNRKQKSWQVLTQINDDYEVGIEEVGALGATRSGRLQRAIELKDRNVLSDADFKDLTMSDPDLRAVGKKDTAGLRAIDFAIAAAIEGREDDAYVDANMDLQEAIVRGTGRYNEARVGGASVEVLERIATFIASASTMNVAKVQEAAPAPPAAAGPGPEPMVDPEVGAELPTDLPPTL